VEVRVLPLWVDAPLTQAVREILSQLMDIDVQPLRRERPQATVEVSYDPVEIDAEYEGLRRPDDGISYDIARLLPLRARAGERVQTHSARCTVDHG
jgi:hypothetical protein